jgi:hypothetical protein
MKLTGENRSTRRKPVPVPLCPPQIPHGLAGDRTRPSEVGGMKLTRENQSTRRKTCPSATLSTKNPTWTDPRDRTRASEVGGRRLTACAKAGQKRHLR